MMIYTKRKEKFGKYYAKTKSCVAFCRIILSKAREKEGFPTFLTFLSCCVLLWLISFSSAYAQSPSNEDDILMFRGNCTRSLSGVGKVPRQPKLLWKFRTSGILEGNRERRGVPPGVYWRGTGWTGQPAKVGNRYYFGSVDGHVYCLDADTGALIWKYKTGHNVKGSVTIAGERIYFGSRDNHLHCISLTDGKLIWKRRIGNDMDSSPCVIDDRIYVGGEDEYIYCFSAQNGDVIWRFKTDGSCESSPSVVNGRVYAG
ncbi:MAG: PQQ-binding-like beta-propeller repeat protein, partial [Candidatus Poribacteria bacterium]